MSHSSHHIVIKEEPVCPPTQYVKLLTVQRDSKQMNSWINMAFEDIIAEPPSIRSATCVWQHSIRSYTGTKNCCYQCTTALLGFFITCFWGLKFATFAFCKIWCCIPNAKLYLSLCGFMATVVRKFIFLVFYAFHIVSSNNEADAEFCCKACCGCCFCNGREKANETSTESVREEYSMSY